MDVSHVENFHLKDSTLDTGTQPSASIELCCGENPGRVATVWRISITKFIIPRPKPMLGFSSLPYADDAS
jgi:hypothetical protein